MRNRSKYRFDYIVQGTIIKTRVFNTTNPVRLSRVLEKEFNSKKEFSIEYKIK